MDTKIKISKSFTVGDWVNLRNDILNSNENWSDVFKVFEDRLQSRFFNPIEKIKSGGKNEGEGFSIALISVVLLEFLAAFELGKIYRTKKEGLSPSEYHSGPKLLKQFLRNSKVFNHHFPSSKKIQEFYENIRCGLVHEARTLNNDVIISENSNKNTKSDLIYFNENGENRLNRDLLLSKIREHITEIKSRIIANDINLRNNFILKMDEISGLKHEWYFIYGSNLFEEQLNSRLKDTSEIPLLKVRCSIKEYEFKYNKLSIDGSSKGNLMKVEKGLVQGIAILILENKLNEFIDKFEKGYEKVEVFVHTQESDEKDVLTFKAYTCISNKLTSAAPNSDYVSMVIRGAKENGLADDYINKNLKTTDA